MDNNLPKGISGERSNGPTNRPGVYRHKDSGHEIITSAADGGTLQEGTTQADALVRVGYVRVGEAKSREELLKMQQDQLAKDKAEAPKDEKKSEK
jgi:hypothetical protein